MSVKEFGQLRKAMMLTTSENDNEAVSALRMANTLLKKHSLTWDAVFARLVKVGPEIEDAAAYNGDVDHSSRIKEALEVAQRDASGSFKEFLQSIHEQFAQRGRLTAAQVEAVFKSARRAGWDG
jgi:hypothetical protein